MEAHLVMATVFKTAEPGVNRPVGGFDSHTLPLFVIPRGSHKTAVLKEPKVQQQRKKLSESVWFWIYLFSTAGLISLVILQGKFDTRQDLEEINFRARMQTYEDDTDNSATDMPARTTDEFTNEQIVTLTPLYILFGLIFIVSWVVLWKQHILRKSAENQSDEQSSTNSDPPLSINH